MKIDAVLRGSSDLPAEPRRAYRIKIIVSTFFSAALDLLKKVARRTI